jgi:uncharacterized SAM-binding protein YcdF (DUF218 family)
MRNTPHEASYLRFKRPTRLEIVIAALIVLIVVAAIAAYRGFGAWLVVRSKAPEHIDVVFTFGGERERERFSNELFRTHPHATWIVSTFDAKVRTRLLGDEVDTGRVVMVDTCSDTWSEVLFLREWLDAHIERLRGPAPHGDSLVTPAQAAQAEIRAQAPSADSSVVAAAVSLLPEMAPDRPIDVVLVSSPYHMRRIKVAVVRLINDPRVRIHYVPTPFDHYESSMDDYRTWWRHAKLRRVVKLEATKILYYLMRL